MDLNSWSLQTVRESTTDSLTFVDNPFNVFFNEAFVEECVERFNTPYGYYSELIEDAKNVVKALNFAILQTLPYNTSTQTEQKEMYEVQG